MSRMIAVFVQGRKNLTRITPAIPFEGLALDYLAEAVRRKDPSKTYEVYEVYGKTWKRKIDLGRIVYWHVGDGFEHKEGWWVE